MKRVGQTNDAIEFYTFKQIAEKFNLSVDTIKKAHKFGHLKASGHSGWVGKKRVFSANDINEWVRQGGKTTKTLEEGN
jgi:hypothetical protein